MPKVTIDGTELEVENGTTIIRAALGAGIDVPYYCWHPRLSVAANCRMCLVEVEKAPKLLPACEVVVRDGMVVQTASEKVLEAREAVMEFLLVNHPIDCPICDQAGECKLQNYYMAHDRTGTRFGMTKVVKKKAVDLGPQVVLDEERCINCTRCVRFMEEVAQNPQLGQFDRGDRAVIGAFPGQPLDDPYSMNTVEICPVGALTSRDFRFKVRSWFLKSADSVCAGCARGCSIIVDHYNDAVQRYRARDNEHVNQGWLCDAGRLSYKRIHDKETQVTVPLAKDADGKLVPITWEQAQTKLAELLGGYVGETDGTLGMSLSAQLTTEGVTAFVELAEQVLQVDTYAILGREDWEADKLLRVADQNPNRAGAELVLEGYSIFDEGPQLLRRGIDKGAVKTLLMVGSDYPEPNEAWLAALEKITVVAWTSNLDASSRAADLVLPLASFAEQDGTFVNHEGRMQRVNRAIKPIEGRRSAIDAATFTATAVGGQAQWRIKNWVTAFNELKKHTNLLADVRPLELGPWGVALESEEDAPVPTPEVAKAS
ncbi:MAG: 2Fe-2S iron-sulfur cluster-binding protein [Deltaproteobacteria bacterium]